MGAVVGDWRRAYAGASTAWRALSLAWKASLYAAAVWLGVCKASRAVAAMGPLAIKLAQAATARPDLFAPGLIDALRSLQDDVPPEPIHDLPNGARLLASGSVAQVYACKIKRTGHTSFARSPGVTFIDGRTDPNDDENDCRPSDKKEGDLVLKVRRPSAVRRAAADRAILAWFLRSILGRALVARVCRRALVADALDHLVAIADDGLGRHIDFVGEAAHTRRMQSLFADDPARTVFVPATVDALCTDDCLAMERVAGVPIRQLGTAAARSSAAHLLARAVCRMVFEFGLVHGDVHEGNVLAIDDPRPEAPDSRIRLALLDMGIVHEIDSVQRRMMVLLVRVAMGVDPPDLLATCIYCSGASRGLRSERATTYATFCARVTSAVSAGRGGSDLGAFVTALAVACADSGVVMDRDMVARIAPLVAADGIARTYMAPSLTVTASMLYPQMFT
ncbi:Abc1 protein kinase [Pandoravirus kuranda]|uniref:Abc1 protein kinase n=1 Tax=Pandoravirus kuranda TaxID=3019033 RepID=A0AA95J480_9VIRU|nr:Abc1 protein kinase [Pandoravirus kuranda]